MKISEIEKKEIEQTLERYKNILIEKQELEEKILFSKKHQYIMGTKIYQNYLRKKLGREYFESTIFYSSNNKAIVFKQLLEKQEEPNIVWIPEI